MKIAASKGKTKSTGQAKTGLKKCGFGNEKSKYNTHSRTSYDFNVNKPVFGQSLAVLKNLLICSVKFKIYKIDSQCHVMLNCEVIT